MAPRTSRTRCGGPLLADVHCRCCRAPLLPVPSPAERFTQASATLPQDWGSSNRATVMRFDGTSWAALGGPGLTTGAAQYTSLAFAPDGTPHLAFQMQLARCRRFDGSAWVAVGPAALSAAAASYVSLAVSAAGVPFVAFSDAGLDGRASVVALSADGTAWQPAGAAGFTAARADYTSLVRGVRGSA